MNKYIEVKIRKVYVLIFSVVLLLLCCFGGVYAWCAYHPNIYIQISNASTGKEGIKMEAPVIAYSGKGIAEPSASIELKLEIIRTQHELICQYVKDNYKTADIKLKMKVKGDQTTLNYAGTAMTLNGERVDFEKEVSLDFAIDADITYRD